MLKITNLTLRNFLSVGNVTQAIRLDDHFLTLILGENTDTNGGLSRNGAGKTTILQAISFALYGESLTDIKLANLINNINDKGMLVTLEFEKDGKSYRVERGRKPTVFKFFELGVSQNQGENKHTQDDLNKVIGMGHTLFQHVTAINTFTQPFLKMKLPEQREVMEELFGATIITEKSERLRKLISGINKRVVNLEADVRAKMDANTRIENSIQKAEGDSARWIVAQERKLASLMEEIEGLQAIDYDAEIAAFEALDAYQAAQTARAADTSAAMKERDFLKQQAALAQREIRDLTSQAGTDASVAVQRLRENAARRKDAAHRHVVAGSELMLELAALMDNIDNPGAHTCVTCHQTLEGTDHLEKVIANLNAQAAKIREKIARENEEAIRARKDEAEFLGEIEAVEREAKEKAASAEAKLGQAQTRVKELESKIEQKTAEIAEINARDIGSKPETLFATRSEAYATKQMYDTLVRDLERSMQETNPYISHIASFRDTLTEIDTKPLDEERRSLLHHDFLLKLLTNKDSFIRKKIIDQNLAHLNARLDHYLDKMSLPHRVKFKSDLSVEINLLGRDFDFSQLSRGEMNRVILATSWSFRDVWESLNERMNLMFVDEMLDQGTDVQGVEAALGILKDYAREGKNVFLISHRDDVRARIDRNLIVKKENGFTTFEEGVGAE